MNRLSLRRSALLLLSTCALAGTLTGCPPEEAPPARDGGVSDAGPVATDSSVATPDVARCVALARTFRDNCTQANGEGDVRVCLWEGYESLCETGNTSLLIAAMECLDETQCRTFSDANDGNACLDALSGRPAALGDVLEGQCAACGGTECAASVPRAEILPYLAPTAAAALDACLGAEECSIEQMVSACAPTIPALSPFSCIAR